MLRSVASSTNAQRGVCHVPQTSDVDGDIKLNPPCGTEKICLEEVVDGSLRGRPKRSMDRASSLTVTNELKLCAKE